MPEARRRRRQKRIRIGLAGLAAISLTAASAGGAMGWMVGGTTSTIAEYKATPKTPIPRTGTGESVRPADASVQTVEPAPDEPTAYFPENNTVQWATTVAPGQALSAISVRNGDHKVNLIAHLAARGTAGGMIPVASMTVSPGREAVIRPPSGEYAMQIVASPVDMPYDRIATLPRSAPTTFGLAPQGLKAVPAVRFEVSKGIIRRLPDPNTTSADTRPDDTGQDQYAWSGNASSDNSSDDG